MFKIIEYLYCPPPYRCLGTVIYRVYSIHFKHLLLLLFLCVNFTIFIYYCQGVLTISFY